MLIYIVQGSTGEYSDHTEWLVKAFDSESLAQTYAEKCGEEFRRMVNEYRSKAACDDYPTSFDLDEHNIKQNAHDPDMQCDYTGTNYNVHVCELEVGK